MWNDKNYHTLDWELKNIFGEKTIKLSIDGGFTCPNRDGTKGSKGCIFCSERGSGDFNSDCSKSIREQIVEQKQIMSKKWNSSTCIAYFQNYTNTYDNVENLRKKYLEALRCENIKGLAIATRPDCIDEETAELLSELNEKTFLWVELGLQTTDERSSNFIRRGYSLDTFNSCVQLLRKHGIRTVIHIILGLPTETRDQMLSTISYVSEQKPWGVKLHMLHVLKNTDLAEYFNKTQFHLLSLDEYVELVCDSLEILDKNIVIHRITGDGKKSNLIEPRWTLNKLKVLSDIDRELKNRGSYQGKYAPL
ncbi:MAG: TIGR01212 family radical SAM protein [Sedimentibacter sp.]|uniref:TIGR01212 family radical SAM protein n=1 Tax=Sedimentibacter sp. TaxID=1960295 RepID=UPI003158F7ED